MNNKTKKILSLIAITLFLTGNAVCASDFDDFYNNGIINVKNENYQKAIDSFNKAISADTKLVDAYFNLASTYEFIGDKKNALKTFEILQAMNPKDSEVNFKIANLYVQSAEYKEALKYLDNILPTSGVYKDSQKLRETVAQKLKEIIVQEITKTNIIATSAKKMDLSKTRINTYDNLQSPTGIAQDSRGNIYVSNFTSNSLTIIYPDGNRETFFKGKPLAGPIGLAIDSKDNIFVANYLENNVIKIAPDGMVQKVFSDISKPYYLYLNNNNELFVSTQGDNNVKSVKLPDNSN